MKVFKDHLKLASLAIKKRAEDMLPESDVLFDIKNHAGVVTLNRPKSLNSFNLPMVSQILPKLREWETSKACVIIKGAGSKAFCSGGDLKGAVTCKTGTYAQWIKYVSLTYNINYTIANLKIPYVALMSGIAMGGGLGLAVHGRFRVATETTVVATPETRIGRMPDCGTTYFLPRLQNHLGFQLGLTGMTLKGKDVVTSGIATHFVPSARLQDLETHLTRCASEAEISRCLSSFSEPPGEFSLAANIPDIDHCFSARTVEELDQRLSKLNNEWSKETLKSLAGACPTMLKVTLRALRRGRRLQLAECLRTEYTVSSHCCGSDNLQEGVRAALIDRDQQPRWRPATLAEVTDADVERYFTAIPGDPELILDD